jgi:phosphoribosylamine--glycine ligase
MGDPETQAVLPRLQTDFLDIVMACIDKKLDNFKIRWKNNAVCCVIAASKGYPNKFNVGYSIIGLEQNISDMIIFHSATKVENEKIVTNGGRVLGITAIDVDIDAARKKAYEAMANIRFRDMHFRKDIGDPQDIATLVEGRVAE